MTTYEATSQVPIDCPFGMRSDALDVVKDIDLSGRLAIITGASAGLGVETARAIASTGAHVILPVRSPEKARSNIAGIEGSVTLADLDLGDFDSIRRFADSILASGRAVDLLINNAGIMATPFQKTSRGHEIQFATNHLGHFLFTTALLPALRQAGANSGGNPEGPRVVCLSSIGHARSPIHFDDIHFDQRPYDKWAAYGQSKTANALFAIGLDAREHENGIRAFAVHPGGILTDLQRDMDMEEMRAFGWIDDDGKVNEMFKTVSQGAATAVWCAVSPLLDGKGGVYCEDCNIAEINTTSGRIFRGVRPHAIDPHEADRLWTVSEEMIG